MPQKQALQQQAIAYYFVRSKDVHEENGSVAITLFGRLSREFTYTDGVHTYSKTESAWVDIKEVKGNQAPEKLQTMPNRICRFEISEPIFRELYSISQSNPEELYTITPFQGILMS